MEEEEEEGAKGMLSVKSGFFSASSDNQHELDERSTSSSLLLPHNIMLILYVHLPPARQQTPSTHTCIQCQPG